MSYEIIWEARGVLRRYAGVLPLRELVESTRACQADPRFDVIRYAISDFTDVERADFVEEDLANVAALQFGAYHTNPNIRAALVIPQPALQNLLGRYTNAALTPYRMRVCERLEEARAWVEQDGRRLYTRPPRA